MVSALEQRETTKKRILDIPKEDLRKTKANM